MTLTKLGVMTKVHVPYKKNKVWSRQYRESNMSACLDYAKLNDLLQYFPQHMIDSIMSVAGDAWKLIFPVIIQHEIGEVCAAVVVLQVYPQTDALAWYAWRNELGRDLLPTDTVQQILYLCEEEVARVLPEYFPYAFTAVHPIDNIRARLDAAAEAGIPAEIRLTLARMNVASPGDNLKGGSLLFFRKTKESDEITKPTFMTQNDLERMLAVEFIELATESKVSIRYVETNDGLVHYLITSNDHSKLRNQDDGLDEYFDVLANRREK
jgi:hypothetical protein